MIDQAQETRSEVAQNKRKVALHELVRIVAEDLVFLRSLDFSAARRTEVRIASSIFRRLLYDGVLGAAWQVLGIPGKPVSKQSTWPQSSDRFQGDI
jgi:hypothetical protein